MLDASVIIVNYRSEEESCRLIAALAAAGAERPAQLIIVDNSPAGGLDREIATMAVDVDYTAMDHNGGFAAGVNRGLDRAVHDHLILLNPDTRPEPGCLSGLVRFLRHHPQVAAAGPKLVPFSAERPLVPSAIRREPNFLTLMVEYTVMGRFFPAAWLSTHYFADPSDVSGPVECAMVQGACFAFHRRWLARVGVFDAQRFFLYWEETDFCRRLRRAGGRVVYLPHLHCRHLGGGSIPTGDQDIRQFWRSFYRYQAKHRHPLYGLLLRMGLATGMALEYAVHLLLLMHRVGRANQLPASNRKRLYRQLRAQFRRA